jgi:hypothetical protein
MHNFSEELLQFIWQKKLLKPGPYISKGGNILNIIKTGELNADAGPDFFNGQVRVNNVLLSGNIEIHINTSDWLKHKHQNDRSYDNIILHVVYHHDTDLPQNLVHAVEVLEIRDLVDESTFINYKKLSEAPEKLPCSGLLRNVEEIKFISWLERMTIERLEDKVERIRKFFMRHKGDYHQTFYTILMRNFGFKINALPFELLATQLPVHILLRHSDNLLQLESILFGMAGLLDEQYKDAHMRALQNEFEFLKKKYSLLPLRKEIFKFSKLRPANFPTLRLAQVAALIHKEPSVFSLPADYKNVEELRKMLEISLSGYWKNHYLCDGKMQDKDLALGKSSAENILINTFAPFYFFYSKNTGKDEFAELALRILGNCDVEDNNRTRLFKNRKELLSSAAASQGVINLYENYCSSKKCLQCGIGASVIASGV